MGTAGLLQAPVAVRHVHRAPPSAPLALVADRFVRCGARAAFDMASGQPVQLLVSDAGSPAQIQSHAERCASLFRAWHPSLAELADYGPVDRAAVFEAWRLPRVLRRWQARDTATAEALASAGRFLHAFGLSVGHLTWQRVVERDGCPVIVPDASTGLSLTPSRASGDCRASGDGSIVAREISQLKKLIAACRRASRTGDRWVGEGKASAVGGPGLCRVVEPAVARIVELLDVGRDGEPRQVHLFGSSGVERATALRAIAREARLPRIRTRFDILLGCVSRLGSLPDTRPGRPPAWRPPCPCDRLATRKQRAAGRNPPEHCC